MDSSELKRKTFHSVAWTIVRAGATNLASFIVFSVLARILSPHEFGIFALAIVFVEFTRIVASAGLGDAVTRAKDLDEALADTAFWTNVALGCCVGCLAWFAAPLYASITRQPDVTPILRALAILVPVASLGGIHTARNLREFGHKAMAARVVAAGILGGGIAIIAAVAGYGVWSLVIQAAIVDGVGLVFAWRSYPWRPRARFDVRRLNDVLAFSSSMMLTQMLFLLVTRLQDMIIGRFVSAAAIGGYRVAWRTIDLISQTTIQPIVGVSLVTLARLQADPDRFRNGFLRMVGLGALFTFPALFGFGVLSDEIIAVLFGPNWTGSGDIVKILMPMAIPFTLNYFTGTALAALGRSGTIMKVAAVQVIMTLVLSLLAAPYGLTWIAAAYVFRAYLTMPYQMVVFRRETGIGGVAMLKTIAPPLIAALTMVGILCLAGPHLRDVLGHGVSYVATSVLLGCLAFGISLLLLGGSYVRSNIDAFVPVWRGAMPRDTVADRHV